jgi:hypothetical protein
MSATDLATKEMTMTGSTQVIRACLAVAVTAFLLKPGFSTVTLPSPALDQKAMVSTDIFAPVPNAPLDAAAKAKEPRIQVAPVCTECRHDDDPA